MREGAELSESDLLKKVDRGLEIAVRDEGFEWEDEGNLIKREKYRYIAIDDLSEEDLPVTYSWYEYGVSAVADKGYISDPMLIPDIEATILEYDVQDIADYYVEDFPNLFLDSWWDKPVLDYLWEFYHEYCPTHLLEIYLANIELRKILERRILRRINTPGAGVPREDFEAIREEILKIQTELASDQQEEAFDGVTLNHVYDDFLAYSEILEDAVLAVALLEDVEPSGPEYRAVTQLKSLFDDTVWPMITSIISYRTVRGPNPDAIRDSAEGKFNSIVSSRGSETKSPYEKEIEEAKSTCDDAGLNTSPDDYPTPDSDISETVDEFMSVIDGDRDE